MGHWDAPIEYERGAYCHECGAVGPASDGPDCNPDCPTNLLPHTEKDPPPMSDFETCDADRPDCEICGDHPGGCTHCQPAQDNTALPKAAADAIRDSNAAYARKLHNNDRGES